MKEESNTNTSRLTLLTDANLKNLLYPFFCDDAIPLHNLQFRKKIVPLLTKDFFPKFSVEVLPKEKYNLKSICKG